MSQTYVGDILFIKHRSSPIIRVTDAASEFSTSCCVWSVVGAVHPFIHFSIHPLVWLFKYSFIRKRIHVVLLYIYTVHLRYKRHGYKGQSHIKDTSWPQLWKSNFVAKCVVYKGPRLRGRLRNVAS